MPRPVLPNKFEEIGMESNKTRGHRARKDRRRGESMMCWTTLLEVVVVAVAVVVAVVVAAVVVAAVVVVVVVAVVAAAVFLEESAVANQTAMTALVSCKKSINFLIESCKSFFFLTLEEG